MADTIHFPCEVIVCGGIIIKAYTIPAGTMLHTHTHSYDHISFLQYGEVELTVQNESTVLKGPCMVEIKANTVHNVYAITDCAWDCVHSFAEAQASGDDLIMESGK